MFQSNRDIQNPSPPTSMSVTLNDQNFFDSSLVAPFTQSLSGIHPTKSQISALHLEPLLSFEYQVTGSWLPSTAPERSEERLYLYREMRARGEVKVISYEAHELVLLYERGKILWCEPKFEPEKLMNIHLPMNPAFELGGDQGQGPVIFVRNPLVQDEITVMNGNHRTMAHVCGENLTTQSLYVVEFQSLRSCQKLLDTSPEWAYTNPTLPENFTF